ncbi:MAG: AEC family transporter [Candidatus Nanopelagicales bacterium]
MSLVVAMAYAIGLGFGWLATRKGAFAEVWPVVVRAQMVAAPLMLTITAVWRLENFDQLLWPAIMVLVLVVMFAYAYSTLHGEQRTAHATLQAMSASPNTGFFLVPITAALGGPSALVSAVLVDRLTIPVWSAWIAVLRREAPVAQSRRTSFVDQAALIAAAMGLLLRFTGPAPQWTATLSLWVAPVLAMSGAATFIGSALHPSQRIDPRPGRRRWIALALLRIALFAGIYLAAPTPQLRLLALLMALSVPPFGPPQFATLYGFSDPVLAAGNRMGWFVGITGVIAAAVIMH